MDVLIAQHRTPGKVCAYVAFIHDNPISVPFLYSVTCNLTRARRACTNCVLGEAEGSSIDFPIQVSQTNGDWFNWLCLNEFQTLGKIKKTLGFGKDCPISYQLEKARPLFHIKLIPNQESDRTPWPAYSLIGDFENGKLYELDGVKFTDHRGKLVFVVFKSKRMFASHERFTLKPEIRAQIEKRLQSRGGNTVSKILDYRVKLLEKATGIVGRPRLHLAVLLAFHSRMNIVWSGFELGRGTIDCLILGDQGTGKSSTVERISKYLNAGEIIGGEHVSLPGLVIGVSSDSPGRFIPVPGRIPQMDGMLLCVDEAHHLISSQMFAKISRLRADGVAQIDKIQSNIKFPARTRLIWVANPIKGPCVPVQSALKRLCERPEARRRFDFVHIVKKSDRIAGLKRPITPEAMFKDQDRALLLHTWSKKNEPVVIQKPSIHKAVTASVDVIRKGLSAKMPEIACPDSVHEKVIRIAVAASEATLRPLSAEAVFFARDFIMDQAILEE